MAQIIRAEANRTYAITTTLFVQACYKCQILFGVPDDFDNRRRNDGARFYCPNGHPQAYVKSELDKAREKIARLERQTEFANRRAKHADERAEVERRSAAAYKGHLTRVKNRIANGVCPVPGCKRSGFDKVMAHIASQHPDWHREHVAELFGT